MFSITRDASSTDLIVRFVDLDVRGPNFRNGELAIALRDKILDHLAEEFIEAHGKMIIDSIHSDDLGYQLTAKIIELVGKKILKEPQNG